MKVTRPASLVEHTTSIATSIAMIITMHNILRYINSRYNTIQYSVSAYHVLMLGSSLLAGGEGKLRPTLNYLKQTQIM